MNNELYHHGVKGQKWGIRRYQPYYNALKKRIGKLVGQAAKKKRLQERIKKQDKKQEILSKKIELKKEKAETKALKRELKGKKEKVKKEKVKKPEPQKQRVETIDDINARTAMLTAKSNLINAENRYKALTTKENKAKTLGKSLLNKIESSSINAVGNAVGNAVTAVGSAKLTQIGNKKFGTNTQWKNQKKEDKK